MHSVTGTIFDVYNTEDEVHVWILSEGKTIHLTDRFYPVIFADGPTHLLKNLINRLDKMNALKTRPVWTIRVHFYSNQPRRVLKITIQKPSILNRIKRKLYALYGKIDLYHTDIETPTAYMFHRNIFPLCRVMIEYQMLSSDRLPRIHSITPHDAITDLDYSIPPFKILGMKLEGSFRLGLSRKNPLLLEFEDRTFRITEQGPELLHAVNLVLKKTDPDIIVSSHGDQIIFPELFTLSQQHNIPLMFDRDVGHIRQIVRQGTSFNTYGSWIFRAPSYPLYGRVHVDSQNSFVFKEAYLTGILELARLARTPIQRMARQSTGGALTAIETNVAIKKHYLVPWQKSAVERPKTAYELLTVDKGGLIFVPNASSNNVFENVAQLDFSQMYPSIMVNHNISPECVNCPCCAGDPSAPTVPESTYHICIKRKGIVSEALGHILQRRRYYKSQIKKFKTSGENQIEKENYETKQNSLKWMLVTSFGYLGYRNAKFGRIESHESVTALGREKLLLAKEIAENSGYELSHAITDCIFISKPDHLPLMESEILSIGARIAEATGIEMGLEGIFSWVIFLPSRQDKLLPVMNRYCGRFSDGSLKYRGIVARRKDMPVFHKDAQLELLEIMAEYETIQDLKTAHNRMNEHYLALCDRLKSGVHWEDLLLRKTASKKLEEYTVKNATFLSMQQLSEKSLSVQAGEKIRYVVLNAKHPDHSKRYLSEELAAGTSNIQTDFEFYQEILFQAYKEIWSYFAPDGFFDQTDQFTLF